MSELHSPPAITALIRTGSEPGYLRSGWDKWMDYCKTRGTTSHPFGAAKAKEAVVIIPDFLPVEQRRHRVALQAARWRRCRNWKSCINLPNKC
ncbi:hypothetical protein [Noviherbaspirillum sp.]|uniref:hypothetical protein n=1 Tax=Noviherbaspirillum sp. TaxID=1926288 RepID=UPI002B479FC5|nr:hypothetical protein [Noviherbaspirillum sp.]HJV83660.1 hypothetical protein [Noviherbaspirillum sp.]